MKRRTVCAMLLGAPVAACGVAGGAVDPVDRAEIDALASAVAALGQDVDGAEATRAAELAFSHTRVLALEYEIEDPPLVHNTKVNMGIKPRGLCWHWAEDMEARLAQERFRTLALHRAIANHDNAILIDHSTAIVSRRGDPFDAGIVLDPWRFGGRLFWAPVRDDTRYDWVERQEVFRQKLARL